MRSFLASAAFLVLAHLQTSSALPYVTDSGLSIEVLNQVDCARKTQVGDLIHVHYNGTLQDGTIFDSSYNRNSPIAFKLGMGRVIKGWDQGLMDMCVGEERVLTIPPELGYGSRGAGPIPPNSVLIFGTKLVANDNAPEDQNPIIPPPTPSITTPVASTTTSSRTSTTSTSATTPASTTTSAPTATPTDDTPPGAENGECQLLGPFALFVQAGLGVLALLSLVFKRWRERPRRPMKVFAFDASKQVLGSALLHLLNLLMSILSSSDIEINAPDVVDLSAQLAKQGDGTRPNPCSFYLINIAIDTTIGIPILVVLLRLLHHGAALTPLANPPESLKSGNYGQPPRYGWFEKQAIIYFIGLLLMKLCVYFIFQLLPWVAWVGDWALRWTEGSEALQITFVMFIFPVCMNAIQYYIVDSFIKDPGAGTHMPVAGSDHSSEYSRVADDDEDDRTERGSVESGNDKDGAPNKGKGETGVKTKEFKTQIAGAEEPEATGQQSSGSSSREDV